MAANIVKIFMRISWPNFVQKQSPLTSSHNIFFIL